MFIRDFVKASPELCSLLEKKLNRTPEEVVMESDLFPYDDIINDNGEVMKVIYLDSDKTRYWDIMEILSYSEEDIKKEFQNDPEELELRLTTYTNYMNMVNEKNTDLLQDLRNNAANKSLKSKGI